MKTTANNNQIHESKFRIAAIHDDQDFCNSCGKTNLRRVVLLINDAGDEMNVGTECAARLCSITTKEVKEEVKSLSPSRSAWREWEWMVRMACNRSTIREVYQFSASSGVSDTSKDFSEVFARHLAVI